MTVDKQVAPAKRQPKLVLAKVMDAIPQMAKHPNLQGLVPGGSDFEATVIEFVKNAEIDAIKSGHKRYSPQWVVVVSEQLALLEREQRYLEILPKIKFGHNSQLEGLEIGSFTYNQKAVGLVKQAEQVHINRRAKEAEQRPLDSRIGAKFNPFEAFTDAWLTTINTIVSEPDFPGNVASTRIEPSSREQLKELRKRKELLDQVISLGKIDGPKKALALAASLKLDLTNVTAKEKLALEKAGIEPEPDEPKAEAVESRLTSLKLAKI